MFDISNLGMLAALLVKIGQMVIFDLFDVGKQLGVEVGCQLNLSLIVGVYLGEFLHIVQMLVFHLGEIGQEFEDELVHWVAFILRISGQRFP